MKINTRKMAKYLNFFESESGFTEAVEAGQLFYPNVSYTEDDDTVHWHIEQPANPVETPMLRMHFSTSTPGQEVVLRNHRVSGVTAIEIDGTPVNLYSGGTYSIESPGSHTAVYQFSSSAVPRDVFWGASGQFDAFTSAEITSAVTSIGVGAFENCGGLSGVSIPDSVTAIGDGAFEDCGGLSGVSIPDSVTWLGAYAFKGCAQMMSARIGSGITSIPSLEFADCTSLQSVTLPGNLMQINHGAFSGCSSLYDVTIPSGVTRIGYQAFMGCSRLTAVYFNSQVPPLLEGSAFTATNDCPIYVPADSVETYKQSWPAYASRIRAMHRISASVNDEDKGEVMLGQETASEGGQVEFEVFVFDSEQNQVSSVTVTDGNGDEVEYTNVWDDHYYFTMPASDVTISVVIGEKEKTKYSVTVNSTDDLVTDVGTCCNEETGDFDWGYEGEPSFPEGEFADFAIRVPEGYLAVSAQASDCYGDSIDDVDMCSLGDSSVYECMFTMPYCDASVFITVEADTRPRYNISWSVNDDSLGVVAVQETALEGETFNFDVKVFDPDANHVSSVTCTDGNGNGIRCWWDFDEGDHSRYHINDMPASDVTIEATIEPKQ